MTQIETLLTAQETADLLRVTVRTLQRMENDGALTPLRIGRMVRYRREDVESFLAQEDAS